jgi:hypothetical protein
MWMFVFGFTAGEAKHSPPSVGHTTPRLMNRSPLVGSTNS